MNALRDTASEAAIEAGKAILEIYHSGDFDVTVKGDDSPLTRADLASHEVIMRHLEPCLLYTSPSPRDLSTSRMPSSA